MDKLVSSRALTCVIVCAASFRALGALPAVPVPPGNPITESKRVLGKILFWDEQLSSDNTTSCGTCHRAGAGGGDPLPARHPGADGAFNTPDDVFGSAGLIKANAADDFDRDVTFALNRQVTARSANPMINAAYATDLFWDGRARTQFIDPQTGAVALFNNAALESQAVGPVVSSVEMAHADRNWDQVIEKLRTAGPMALATNLPSDVAQAVGSSGTYPSLFEAAFGDRQITASRIAMAIATYERTLISDQAPWDRFVAGDAGALTPGQQAGWNFFQASECAICHVPPLFTDNLFRNIALRPNGEDIGRQAVTGLAGDRGKFKTASLRNLATRPNLMHTGQFTNVNQVFAFYAGPGAPGNPNRDPILPSAVPPPQINAITDFIVNGLTDPRVRLEQFPFDRPRLHTESAPLNPLLIAAGSAGTGGFVPRIIANCPPNAGNSGFKIGLDRALAGATARLAIATVPPVGGVVNPTTLSDPIVVAGVGTGNGFATFHWPIPRDRTMDGQVYFMQWRIADPAAPDGVALSNIAQVTLFGGSALPHCPGDADDNFVVNFSDVTVSLANFGAAGVPFRAGDSNGDGVVDFADLTMTLARWGNQCM
ncbi:MAG: hypothetical protein JNK58_12990 [Phycisphaerae bacterium]|nr:hypothetical protein [Phycisphaerae bacterium]